METHQTAEKRQVVDVKLDGDISHKRREYLEALDRVLEFSFDRIGNRYTKAAERISWSRVVVAAVTAAGPILRDFDLEQLKERLSILEEKLKVAQ